MKKRMRILISSYIVLENPSMISSHSLVPFRRSRMRLRTVKLDTKYLMNPEKSYLIRMPHLLKRILLNFH